MLHPEAMRLNTRRGSNPGAGTRVPAPFREGAPNLPSTPLRIWWTN